MKKRIQKKKLTRKEKKEITFILCSVLVVAIIGVFLHLIQDKKIITVGAATGSTNPNYATTPETINILNKYTPARGNGDCNTLCKDKTCVPLFEPCDANRPRNQCYCIKMPK